MLFIKVFKDGNPISILRLGLTLWFFLNLRTFEFIESHEKINMYLIDKHMELINGTHFKTLSYFVMLSHNIYSMHFVSFDIQ